MEKSSGFKKIIAILLALALVFGIVPATAAEGPKGVENENTGADIAATMGNLGIVPATTTPAAIVLDPPLLRRQLFPITGLIYTGQALSDSKLTFLPGTEELNLGTFRWETPAHVPVAEGQPAPNNPLPFTMVFTPHPGSPYDWAQFHSLTALLPPFLAWDAAAGTLTGNIYITIVCRDTFIPVQSVVPSLPFARPGEDWSSTFDVYPGDATFKGQIGVIVNDQHLSRVTLTEGGFVPHPGVEYVDIIIVVPNGRAIGTDFRGTFRITITDNPPVIWNTANPPNLTGAGPHTVTLSGTPGGRLVVPAGATVTITGGTAAAPVNVFDSGLFFDNGIILDIAPSAAVYWSAYVTGDIEFPIDGTVNVIGGGTFTLVSGTIAATNSWDSVALIIDGSTAVFNTGAKINGVHYGLFAGNKAHVTIRGGIFNTAYNTFSISDDATIVIYGGTFNGEIYTMGTLAINGGIFNEALVIDGGGSATLTGGIFNGDIWAGEFDVHGQPANVTIAGNIAPAGDIHLDTGAIVTVNAGGRLTIGAPHTMHVNQGAVVNNHGTIINNGTVISEGTFTNPGLVDSQSGAWTGAAPTGSGTFISTVGYLWNTGTPPTLTGPGPHTVTLSGAPGGTLVIPEGADVTILGGTAAAPVTTSATLTLNIHSGALIFWNAYLRHTGTSPAVDLIGAGGAVAHSGGFHMMAGEIAAPHGGAIRAYTNVRLAHLNIIGGSKLYGGGNRPTIDVNSPFGVVDTNIKVSIGGNARVEHSGTFAALNAGGSVTISDNATLTSSGAHTIIGGSVTVDSGTITATGANGVAISSSNAFVNSGTITATGAGARTVVAHSTATVTGGTFVGGRVHVGPHQSFWVVTYDPAGGTRTDGGALVQLAGRVTPPIVTRPGFNFTGWNEPYPSATTHRTITALWEEIIPGPWTVTFALNGGNIGGNTADVVRINVVHGTATTAPANPTRHGYNFTGWSPALNLTNVTENRGFTAQWALIDTGSGGNGNGGDPGNGGETPGPTPAPTPEPTPDPTPEPTPEPTLTTETISITTGTPDDDTHMVEITVAVDTGTGEVTLAMAMDILRTLVDNALANVQYAIEAAEAAAEEAIAAGEEPPPTKPAPAPTVIIDLSGIEDATAAVLTVEMAEAFANEEVAVTLVFPGAEITLDADLLAALTDFDVDGDTPIVVGLDITTLLPAPIEEEGPPLFETTTLVTVKLSISVGDEVIGETTAPLSLTIPLDGFNLDGVNTHRLTVRIGNPTIIASVFDAETGLISFETNATGEFSIVYLETLKRLTLQPDSHIIYDLAGNAPTQVMDVTPLVIDGRPFVPVRFVAYALGAEVDSMQSTAYSPAVAILVLHGQELRIPLNGTITPELAALGMEVPAIVLNNRTMVPLCFVRGFFGALVEWDTETQIIEILMDSAPPTTEEPPANVYSANHPAIPSREDENEEKTEAHDAV